MMKKKTAYNTSFVTGKYYLYRHIREDSGNPFYIGIGTRQRGHNDKSIYLRAYTKANRSEFWENITNKTDYYVEILYESKSIEEIKRKEIEFIKLYGRRENGGMLCNMTDGGDGLNTSNVSVTKRMKTMKENGSYDLMVDRLRLLNSNRVSAGEISRKKSVFVYGLAGSFINKYLTIKDCSEKTGVSESTISRAINNNRGTRKYIFSFYDMGDTIDISDINLIHNNPANCSKRTIVIDKATGEKTIHGSMKKAANYIGMKNHNHMWRAIKLGFYKNYEVNND